MCNVTVVYKLAKKYIQVYCNFMKVLPVTFGIKNQFSANSLKLHNTNISARFTADNTCDTFTLNNNSINFNGNIPNFITGKNDLKKLAKNGHLSCIWCGGSMFMQSELDAFQHFSKRLASNSELFARVMMHFKDYLPAERIQLIKQISHYNKAYPNQNLKFIFNKMTPAAEKKLIRKQFFIMHKLKKLKPQLPIELHKDFDILMEHSKYRILGIPYVSEYSGKEFYYQLSNLSKTLPAPIKEEILDMAQILTHPIFKEAGGGLPEKWLKRFYKQTKIAPNSKGNYISPSDKNAKDKVKLLVLNKIIEITNTNSPAVTKLCNLTKNKVSSKPVSVQFSNKAFTFKLHEIIDNLQDKALIEKFNNIISKLPTSLGNKEAFIVKYKNEPTDTIISKLLADSLVTLEHITPILRNTSDKELKTRNKDLAKSARIKRGTDNIGNWALAHSWCNCLHGSKNIKNEKFPFSKEAGIKYFRTLVQDVNNGLLSGESVINMAKNYFEQTGIRIKLKGMKYTHE